MLAGIDKGCYGGQDNKVADDDRKKYFIQGFFLMQPVFINCNRNSNPDKKEEQERLIIHRKVYSLRCRFQPDKEEKYHRYHEDVGDDVVYGAFFQRIGLIESLVNIRNCFSVSVFQCLSVDVFFSI